MTIWHKRIACWIRKATNTHPKACWIPKAINTQPEYVILINFPPQQWLHEHASMLHYTYIACLVFNEGHIQVNSAWHVAA